MSALSGLRSQVGLRITGSTVGGGTGVGPGVGAGSMTGASGVGATGIGALVITGGRGETTRFGGVSGGGGGGFFGKGPMSTTIGGPSSTGCGLGGANCIMARKGATRAWGPREPGTTRRG